MTQVDGPVMMEVLLHSVLAVSGQGWQSTVESSGGSGTWSVSAAQNPSKWIYIGVAAIHDLGWWTGGPSPESTRGETDRSIQPWAVCHHTRPHVCLRAPAPTPSLVSCPPSHLAPRVCVRALLPVRCCACCCVYHMALALLNSTTQFDCFMYHMALALLNSTAQIDELWISPHCSAMLSENSTTQTNSFFYTRHETGAL
jgi:hypothetical protein